MNAAALFPRRYTRTFGDRTFEAALPPPGDRSFVPFSVLRRFEHLAAVYLAESPAPTARALRLFCTVLLLRAPELAAKFHVTEAQAMAWMKGEAPIPGKTWSTLTEEVIRTAATPGEAIDCPGYPLDQIRVVEVPLQTSILVTRTYDARVFQAVLPFDTEGSIPGAALRRFERQAAVLLAHGPARGPRAFRLFCGPCGLNWLRLAERFHLTPETAQAWMRGKAPVPPEAWDELAAEVLRRGVEPLDEEAFPGYPFDTIHAVEVTEAAG